MEVNSWPKTLTVRVDDATYHKIKTAADSERGTISNVVFYLY
jgi:hypothetical protein